MPTYISTYNLRDLSYLGIDQVFVPYFTAHNCISMVDLETRLVNLTVFNEKFLIKITEWHNEAKEQEKNQGLEMCLFSVCNPDIQKQREKYLKSYFYSQ